MKKIICAALCAVFCAGAAGCAAENNTSGGSAETSAAVTTAAETSAAETSAAETSAAETSAAETSAAETTAAETSAAETTAVKTSTPKTTTAAAEVVSAVKMNDDGSIEYRGKTLRTIGDVMDAADGEPLMGTYGDKLICGFGNEDGAVRAFAELTDELFIAYTVKSKIEGEDDGLTEFKEEVRSAALTSAEDLTPLIPSQEELDKFVGRKVQALYDAGYTFHSISLSGQGSKQLFDKGCYRFAVAFTTGIPGNEDGENSGSDDIIISDYELKDLTVESVTYYGLSDGVLDLSND